MFFEYQSRIYSCSKIINPDNSITWHETYISGEERKTTYDILGREVYFVDNRGNWRKISYYKDTSNYLSYETNKQNSYRTVEQIENFLNKNL